MEPGREVVATAPVRVADVGGWTDTWFAARGAVCSVAVGPGARAAVRTAERGDGPPVRVAAPDLGLAWAVDPGAVAPGPHAVLDHAVAAWVASLETGGLDGLAVEVTVSAAVPPGSSLGTSAAVVVALVAALEALAGRTPTPGDLALRAHRVETGLAGRQSGVQDQVAAAHGGLSWIEVDPYPAWRRDEVAVDDATRAALAERLVTVHRGGAHDSSALHGRVIAAAEAGDRAVAAVLDELRELAARARAALEGGDLATWGAVLTEATEAQARLHPDLVGADARALAALGAAHGAGGWKVNGAGGAGGSVTLLGPADPSARSALGAEVASRGWSVLPLTPCGPVRVT